jgi:hypothetical protein
MRSYGTVLFPIVALLAITVAGCSGSSSSTLVATNPGGTLMAGTSPGSTSVTHPSGYNVNITLPSTADGSSGTISVTLSTTLPAGVAAPAALARTALTIGATLTPMLYMVLTPSATVTFTSTPGFSFVLPSGTAIAAGSSPFVGFYDPAQSTTGWVTLLGPGAVGGQTITFPAATGSLTLKAGTSYSFLLFSTAQSLRANPPQAAPAPMLTVLPTALTLAGVGQNFAGTLTATESTGVSPAFSSFTFAPVNPTLQCNGYTFSNSAPAPGTNAVTIMVWQLIPAAGTCNFTLVDITSGNTKTIPVTLPSSALPTPSPSPTMLVSPTALTLAGVGQSYAGTLTATESSGSVPPVITSFTFAPVSPTTSCSAYTYSYATPAPMTSAVTITVWQLLPTLGTCNFTLVDSTSGNTKTVPITLPSAGVSVGGN